MKKLVKKKVVKKVVKKPVKTVKAEPDFTTLKGICDHFGVEYREGVTRLLDVAKELGVNYVDGMEVKDLLAQEPKKKQ